jgi:hypothetical protein
VLRVNGFNTVLFKGGTGDFEILTEPDKEFFNKFNLVIEK